MKPKSFSQRPKRIAPVVLAITLLLLTSPVATAREVHPPLYTIEDLGTLGSDTLAYGINNSGQVVGFSFVEPYHFAHAFRFSDDVGIVDLNQFTNSSITYGAGINNPGQVAGHVDWSGGAGGYRAFRYTDGVGLVDLGTLPGYRFSYGGRINDRGQVIGSAYGSAACRTSTI